MRQILTTYKEILMIRAVHGHSGLSRVTVSSCILSMNHRVAGHLAERKFTHNSSPFSPQMPDPFSSDESSNLCLDTSIPSRDKLISLIRTHIIVGKNFSMLSQDTFLCNPFPLLLLSGTLTNLPKH